MKTITLVLLVLCLQCLYGVITPKLVVYQNQLSHVVTSTTRSIVAYNANSSGANGVTHMTVWDISNPDLAVSGYTFYYYNAFQYDTYFNVSVVNNLLFYTIAPRTFIYDITNIYEPELIYTINIDNNFCIGIVGNHLLLGMLNGDIRIYDFSDPADIQYKGLSNVLPHIWKIYEFGGKIAVSCGLYPYRTIKLLELNEITYTLSEFLSFEFNAIDNYIGRMGQNMVVQSSDGHMFVYDCSTQGIAPLLNSFEPSDEMRSIVTNGSYLFSSDNRSYNGNQGVIKAWTFNNQLEFENISSYYFSNYFVNYCTLLKPSNNLLPCKTSHNYAFWLDISDLQPPENLVSQYENGNNINTMALLDMGSGYIYCNSPQGLTLLDINPDYSITVNSVIDSLSWLDKMNMRNNFLYGFGNSDYQTMFKTLDCSIPTRPVVVSEFPYAPDYYSIFRMSGDVIYAGPNYDVAKYRIDNNTGIPVYEKNLSFENTNSTYTGTVAFNDFAEYQGNDYGIGWWYASGIDRSPYLVYWLPQDNIGYTTLDDVFDKVYIKDRYLYTFGLGVNTYKLFHNREPRYQSAAYKSGIFDGATYVISYLDNYLIVSYALCNFIAIFDVSTPANPVLVQKIQQPYAAFSLFVKDDKLFAANGVHGISVYELSGVTLNSDHTIIPTPSIISAYPNPFSTQVKLEFELKQPGPTKTAIYNVKGQLVKVIGSDELKQGKTELVWDGKDSTNRTCAVGVYFVRVNSTTPFKVKKILKLQ